MRIVLCYPLSTANLAQIQSAVPNAQIVNAGQERIAGNWRPRTSFVVMPRSQSTGPRQWLREISSGSSHRLRAWIIVWCLRLSLTHRSSSPAAPACLPTKWPSKRWRCCWGLSEVRRFSFALNCDMNSLASRPATYTARPSASWVLVEMDVDWPKSYPCFVAASWRRTASRLTNRHTLTSCYRRTGSKRFCLNRIS